MQRILAILLFFAPIIAPNPASAQDWKVLSNSEILNVLTGKRVEYLSASQVFLDAGLTTYDAGYEQRGRWAVNDDRYCSQWPPAENWTCHSVEQEVADANRIRFIAPDGKIVHGRVAGQ